MRSSGPESFPDPADGLRGLRGRRRALDAWLADRGLSHTVSVAVFRLYRAVCSALADHADGRCLDAGSGRSPFGSFLRDRGFEVVSVDIEDRGADVDFVADVQNMPEIASGSMRTVLCTQVLEHVPGPQDALREFNRVLAAGGTLVLSVPHLSVIHEAPNDFYRFTRFGLAHLLRRANFRIESATESGGLISFLAHGFSAGLMSSVGSVPGLRRLTWRLNYLLMVRALAPVDRLLGLRRIYPCNYVVVARKDR